MAQKQTTPTATEKLSVAETKNTSVIKALAEKMSCDPAKLAPMLRKTAFASCRTDEEFMSMCIVANTYGLNPLLKEIYAFPSKSGAVIPIVSADGWMHIMNTHPAHDGIEFVEDKDSCTAIIYRKDRQHPTKVTEYLAECMGNTEPWKRWPRRMLRHKATIQCARLAYGLGGIYDEDEARRIDEATAPVKMSEKQKDSLRAALGIGKQDAPAEDAEVVDITMESAPVAEETSSAGAGDGIAADIAEIL